MTIGFQFWEPHPSWPDVVRVKKRMRVGEEPHSVVQRVGVEGPLELVGHVPDFFFPFRPARVVETGGMLECAQDRVGLMSQLVAHAKQTLPRVCKARHLAHRNRSLFAT